MIPPRLVRKPEVVHLPICHFTNSSIAVIGFGYFSRYSSASCEQLFAPGAP
nr:MAG TPA: hypothetical protein [Caudoviricetes sp.]